MRLLKTITLAGLCACQSAAIDHTEEADRRLNVAFVVVDGVYNTELTAPFDIFQHTKYHVDPGMRVFSVAPSLEPVQTFEGLRILPDYAFADSPRIDVLVIPSAEHSIDTDLENEAMIQFVRERGLEAGYVMSLCDGAFVLAQAGLLAGRDATTFPSDRAAMQARYPNTHVHDDAELVRDGKFITSVGGAPSFDAALYLTELLYGPAKARSIAGGLVIDWDLAQIDFLEFD